MADEVFYPQTIDPTPLPQVTGEVLPASTTPQKSSSDVIQPQTVNPLQFPQKTVAPAVISDSINTLSKQILGGYSFGVLGAISIGTYQFGISGEIKLSPDGLIATNLNGETTIAIDGATGDVTIKGTLQAGTLIGGDNSVVIERGLSGGRIVLYNAGVPSILLGDPTT